MECYKPIRRDVIMQFIVAWMELEDIVLNEVSQKKMDDMTYHVVFGIISMV